MLRSSKVPQVTSAFWITKILTTGMGEALADFFDHAFNPVWVVLLSGLVLLVSLWIQIVAPAFSPWRYWSAVSMVSVFGTLAADAVHAIIGVPYWVSSIIFLIALLAIFLAWKVTEKSISISQIVSTRQEFFYWSLVMVTFALGTAAGDMTANTLGWGFLVSGIIFGISFVVPLLLNRFASVGSVATFWAAYVITRPFGASVADWLALPPNRGGVGWGTLNVSLALIAAIALFVLTNQTKAKSLASYTSA